MANLIKKIGFLCLIVIAFMLTSSVFAQDISNSESYEETFAAIEKYQEQYFKIVKRNDVLLKYESDKALNNDRKELKKLFKKVKKQITNKSYIKKYNDIERRYAKCNDMTTQGMNKFAEKNYNDVSVLLNEVYNYAESKIRPGDKRNFIESEQIWQKEFENYKQVYDEMDFGTIGTIIYYDYRINMVQFRALLLMLYL